MQGAEILQTLAEVSVAFAGFTGVVVAFGRRADAWRSPVDRHAFRGMLASSLQTLLFSVLPFLLHAAGVDEPALWRVGSAIMLAGLGVGAAADLHFARRTDRSLWAPADQLLQGVIPALGLIAIGAQAFNVAGGMERAFAPYLGGLLFFLFFSSVMFVRLLVGPDPDRSD